MRGSSFGPLLAKPQRAGHSLRCGLAGRWSARRGPCRIVYELDQANHALRVLHVADVE